jgi:hypothetical protein
LHIRNLIAFLRAPLAIPLPVLLSNTFIIKVISLTLLLFTALSLIISACRVKMPVIIMSVIIKTSPTIIAIEFIVPLYIGCTYLNPGPLVQAGSV